MKPRGPDARFVKQPYRWFCECEDTEHDSMGQCSRCGRVTRERIEASLELVAS